MNPLTNMKNVKKLSEQELRTNNKTSWHDQYKNSAWIFVGGLPYDLTEGDVICIFSQYGEIVNLNLVRDKDTGKQKGFCFICYEDQRSTVLAVDNFNGITILKRIIRVDHVQDYKVPKDSKKIDEHTRQLHDEGCGPGAKILQKPIETIIVPDVETIDVDIQLPERLPIYPIIKTKDDGGKVAKKKKGDKVKKSKKKKSKKRKKQSSSSDDSDHTPPRRNSSDSKTEVRVKQEKEDSEYDRYMKPISSIYDERRTEKETKNYDSERRDVQVSHGERSQDNKRKSYSYRDHKYRDYKDEHGRSSHKSYEKRFKSHHSRDDQRYNRDRHIK